MRPKTCIPLMVLLVLVLLFIPSAVSGAPASERPARVLDKIAPWVIAHTANSAQAEFFVVLKQQADLSAASSFKTRQDKARYVYTTLVKTARSAQAPILKWLDEQGIEHRAYYIVDMIWVRADQTAALALAARSDVARLDGNPQLRVLPDKSLLIPEAQSPNQPAGVEASLSYVHAPDVWALGFTGQGVVVGGQDTGYQWDHPALKPQYRGWNGAIVDHNYNWHDSIHANAHGPNACGVDSTTPCDDYGHGTHTMGTAIGSDGGANQIGMAPGARWMGCRNMDNGWGSPASYIECFEFFLAPYPIGGDPMTDGDPGKAPDVTNNSWTCPAYEGCVADSLLAAVQAQRAAGIMTVVSAGNDGPGCSSLQEPPSFYADVYTIGALTTGTDTIASFSNRGPVTVDGSNRRKPDLAAPGTSIRSSWPGNSYDLLSGTSMAGPHVVGAVALLWSSRPEYANQITATEQLLNDSAVHIDSTACGSSGWPNNTFGYGRLDVLGAVGVDVSPISQTRFVNAGALVTYTLRVTNTAPIVDAFDLMMSAHHWPTTATLTTTGSLPPGAGVPLTFTVAVPGDLISGTFDSVMVTVASPAEPTRRVTATLTTNLTLYDAVLTPTSATRRGEPGTTVTYTLHLTNTGNVSNTFNVTPTWNMWSTSVTPTQITLAAQASLQLQADVTVPLTATFGLTDTVRIAVAGQNVARFADLTTEVFRAKFYLPLILK